MVSVQLASIQESAEKLPGTAKEQLRSPPPEGILHTITPRPAHRKVGPRIDLTGTIQVRGVASAMPATGLKALKALGFQEKGSAPVHPPGDILGEGQIDA